ncbi:carbonic anhydrase family protein [Polaribacter batillariae]|uniref:Carbonic anhydrase family protein n=1 Tax=Polaribacter batillariae TaxID=2808900 RepID=A0ABX7SSM2_9FLAO|nr:carbonic anhydrase family protein [Polaribacter batillariae]QTD37247.1 carbonic anhydrase family protein [Polaribacter batillariae]
MKIKNSIFAVVLLAITFTSCNKGTKTAKQSKKTPEKEQVSATNHQKKHWSYAGETGPEHWVEIEKNSECGGEFQSPVNIVSVDALADESLKPLDIHYASSTKIHDVKNNGHSIQYNFESGDYINYKGDTYDLKQIHFHESSEHTINGIRFPLVIHMVHVSKKGEYLVLAVMAKEGVSSAPFDFLESYLPLKKGEIKTVDSSFNLNLNLPKNKGYYNYVGSLTTPPCTQGVNWFVFKEPITVSLEQVNKLKKLMPINNYRNEQPLNGRKIKMTK